MRYLKLDQGRQLGRLGNTEEKITDSLYNAAEHAPLNYFTPALLASCLGLYVNFLYPERQPVELGTFPILLITVPALLITIATTASLLGDFEKLCAYSEDFTQEEPEKSIVDNKVSSK